VPIKNSYTHSDLTNTKSQVIAFMNTELLEDGHYFHGCQVINQNLERSFEMAIVDGMTTGSNGVKWTKRFLTPKFYHMKSVFIKARP